jgi:hypothetical protein
MSFRFVPSALAAAVMAGVAWTAVPADAAALPVAGAVSLARDSGLTTSVQYHQSYRHHGHYRAPYPYRRHHGYPHHGHGPRYGHYHGRY